jgi:16S rRNA (guanine(966)-N(2))-methyltransferase RsmD
MRIIAGTFRSRPLKAPPGLATRPTSDRLRETLFNVLALRINSAKSGLRFLDLYAGSGAVGIEAISRGVTHVTFVEQSRPALKILQANLASLGITSGFEVESLKVSAYLRVAIKANEAKFNLVFLDPPYDLANEYENTLHGLGALLAPDALVIAEHRRKEKLPEKIAALKRTRLLEQGDAALSFYQQEIQSS